MPRPLTPFEAEQSPGSPEPPFRRTLLIVALPATILLFYLLASAHFRYTPDDTYIYLKFAKNLISGNGMSFNPGQVSYGFTSPLWLFIISLGGAVGADLFIAAKGIDLVIACLALLAFYLVANEVVRDAAVAICATVAFSANAWMVRWAGSGMETSLSVALVLLTFLYCLRNEYFASVVMAGLLSLARPEGALIVPLILADLFLNSENKRRATKMGAALLIIFAMIQAPWLLYAFRTFNSILPNTALAKMGFQWNADSFLATSVRIAKTVAATDGIPLLTIIAAGYFRLRKPIRSDDITEDERAERFYIIRQSLIGLAWTVVIPLFYLLTDTNVVSRYFLIFTPLLTVYAFFFLHRLIMNSGLRRHVYGFAALLAALILAQNQFFYEEYVHPGIELFEDGMESCLIPIGKWFKDNTPPGTTIIVPDIGAVGYFSDRILCDAGGIISPFEHPFVRKGIPPNDIIGEGLYAGSCEVDYVVHRAEVPEKLKNRDLVPVLSKPFQAMTLLKRDTDFFTVYKMVKLH